jgi:hypothetical protein
VKLVVTLSVLLSLVSGVAHATPTTTVWAPSTTAVQGFLVPHLTYDTYFAKGVAPGAPGSPLYPVTTGVTMGVLPFDSVNLEVGFDLLLPSPDPFLLNAKLGLTEGALFSGSPGVAVGVYGVGTKSDVTNYDVLYAQLQKTLPWGGYLSVGGYYGAGSKVLFSSDLTATGSVDRVGFIGAIASPDLVVGKPYLQKIVLAADVQTGKNVWGAGGVAASFYFTDTIAVLTGPVYFLEKATQPGGRSWMWTVQLDVDLPLRPAPAPAAAAPAPTAAQPAVQQQGATSA